MLQTVLESSLAPATGLFSNRLAAANSSWTFNLLARPAWPSARFDHPCGKKKTDLNP
tara:strand:- start:153 stop:323 length:171 start_codon:yes stop_codon:yes gene_type:complete